MPDASGATRTRRQAMLMEDQPHAWWLGGLMADNHAMIEATEFPVFDVQGFKATS